MKISGLFKILDLFFDSERSQRVVNLNAIYLLVFFVLDCCLVDCLVRGMTSI